LKANTFLLRRSEGRFLEHGNPDPDNQSSIFHLFDEDRSLFPLDYCNSCKMQCPQFPGKKYSLLSFWGNCSKEIESDEIVGEFWCQLAFAYGKHKFKILNSKSNAKA